MIIIVIGEESVFETAIAIYKYEHLFSISREILQNDVIPEKNSVDCGLRTVLCALCCRLITVVHIIWLPFRDTDFYTQNFTTNFSMSP